MGVRRCCEDFADSSEGLLCHFAIYTLSTLQPAQHSAEVVGTCSSSVQWPNCKIIRQGPSQAGAKQAAFKSRFILVIIATYHLNHFGFMQHDSNCHF